MKKIIAVRGVFVYGKNSGAIVNWIIVHVKLTRFWLFIWSSSFHKEG